MARVVARVGGLRTFYRPLLGVAVCLPCESRVGRADVVEPCADAEVRVFVVLALRSPLAGFESVVVTDVAVPKACGRQISEGAGLVSASCFFATLAGSTAAVRAVHAAVVRSDAAVP